MSEKFLWRALLLAGLAVAAECGSPEPFKSLAITNGAGGSGPGAAGVSGSAGVGGNTGAAGDSGGGGATGLAGVSGLAGSTGAAGNTGNGGASGAAGTAAGGVGGGTAGAGGVDGGAAGSKADAGADASGGSGGAAGGAAGAPADAGPPVNYCDRTHWKATASASYTMAPAGPPIQGIDGNLTTRWTSGRAQDGTDYYQVDFGGTVKLTKITLDNTMDGASSAGDFPAGYQVYASTDGTTFGATAFITGNGAASSTVISFPQQTVRAVKIKEIGSRTGIWWSIGELQTVCSL